MGKWNNRWIPNQRSYRHHDNRRRFHRESPPPYLAESNENSVPEWEKKFCYKVGSVPWRKVLDTKSYASYYPDVMDWDDSEAKNNFHNAKRRFWELMNGLPADDAPLPDPNAYIDEIDWDTCIDTELYNDLESALLAVDEDAEGETAKTGACGNGVVDISALTRNSKWPEWSQGTADEWNNGGCWDKSSDGGWGKADKWVSGPVNAITDDPKIASGDNPWEFGLPKTNGPEENIPWGDSNDKSLGWKQPNPSYQVTNQHDVANSRDDNFQGGGEVKGIGCRWTVSGNNSWGRNRQQNKINKTKAWGYDSIQRNETSTTREWSRHGNNSRCENSLVNNQHTQTEPYHKGNGNWNTGNRGDRKRENPNNFTPRSRNPIFHHTGNQREPWRNGQSMQQSGSSFRVHN